MASHARQKYIAPHRKPCLANFMAARLAVLHCSKYVGGLPMILSVKSSRAGQPRVTTGFGRLVSFRRSLSRRRHTILAPGIAGHLNKPTSRQARLPLSALLPMLEHRPSPTNEAPRRHCRVIPQRRQSQLILSRNVRTPALVDRLVTGWLRLSAYGRRAAASASATIKMRRRLRS